MGGMLFQLSFALLLASCLATLTHPGFHNTGHIQWRDCTANGHDAWVKITDFDIMPGPIRLPGDVLVTIERSIDHQLDDSITLDVLIEKQLLGRWTTLPCVSNVGSCHYDDFCMFANVFAHSRVCLNDLIGNIPISCPIAPDHLRMINQVFSVTGFRSECNFLIQNKHFHFKVELKDKASQTLRGCLEAYLDFTT